LCLSFLVGYARPIKQFRKEGGKGVNSEQLKHLARSLQTIAIGQLAFFGYKALEAHHLGLVAFTLALYAIMDGAALYVLKGAT
jgi:hypothetical protein